MDIRWLGQSCFTMTEGGTTLLVDPFLTDTPKGAADADSVEADVIALTHGHFDHLGDTVDIARRTGATVVAIMELAGELMGALGEDHPVLDPNLGGTVKFDWGWIK
ncbi:MAG: MBL fold metallo-hydrolase, partial [Actinomycetota bacterium]|nr:MBL fold metallo-hydrolase [Actinomycetota bacterium]